MMPRLNDWPERLDALLRACAARPFAWGSHDCATFAADVVRALTGCDPLEKLRGSYQCEREALRLLQPLGGLRFAVETLVGQPVAAQYATAGDLLLISNAGREMLAMCNGQGFVCPGPDGLVASNDAEILAAWRVG